MAYKTGSCINCRHLNCGTTYEYNEQGLLQKSKLYMECNKHYKLNTSRNSRFPFKSTACIDFVVKENTVSKQNKNGDQDG